MECMSTWLSRDYSPRVALETSKLVFSPQTVLRIVALGIWDYIENKVEVRNSISLSLQPDVLGAGRHHCPVHPKVEPIPTPALPAVSNMGWEEVGEGYPGLVSSQRML